MPSPLYPMPDKEADGDLPLCSRRLRPFWDVNRHRCSSAATDIPSFPHFCVPELRRIKREHAELVELGKTASAFAAALKKAGF